MDLTELSESSLRWDDVVYYLISYDHTRCHCECTELKRQTESPEYKLRRGNTVSMTK